MADMRVAMNTDSGEGRPGGLHSRCFPLSLRCCCCPFPCLRKIQDWLHLVLVLGVLSSVVCVVMQVVEITSVSHICETTLCYRQWVVALVLVPSMWDFIKFLGAYDESLQDHQERAEREVGALIQQINKQVCDMQVVCGKLADGADDFAARSFNQSLERFQKFIDDIPRFYSILYQDAQLVDQLRTFTYKWFTTYCQSQLDQDKNSSVKGLKKELDKCYTIQEVCASAAKRLTVLKNAPRIQVRAQSFLENWQRSQPQAIADGSLEDGVSHSSSTISTISDASGDSDVRNTKKCGVRWITFGRAGCGRQGPRTSDGARVNQGWPLTLGFCCGTLTILSRRHLNHLIYLVVDVLVICWELRGRQTYTMLLVIANFACVISTLACFAQIDEIAKLQQKISKYQARSEKVTRAFQENTETWNKVQQLHDLWNYRTMPFLAIMGKIHAKLDDMDREIHHKGTDALRNDTRREWLEHANACLEALDQKLGLASDWTRAGGQTDEWKLTIGRQLKNAEMSNDLGTLIQSLPLLTNPALASLEDC